MAVEYADFFVAKVVYLALREDGLSITPVYTPSQARVPNATHSPEQLACTE